MPSIGAGVEVGVGTGVGDGPGDGVAEGLGDSVGPALGEAEALGVGVGVDAGLGVGVELPQAAAITAAAIKPPTRRDVVRRAKSSPHNDRPRVFDSGYIGRPRGPATPGIGAREPTRQPRVPGRCRPFEPPPAPLDRHGSAPAAASP